MRTSVAVVIPLLHMSIASAAELAPFSAHYDVSNDEYTVGTAEITLQRKDEYWELTSETQPTGLFSLLSKGNTRETSLISLAADKSTYGISAIRYTFFQKDAKAGRNFTAEFKHEISKILVTTESGDSSVVDMHEAHDPLSSMAVIMRRLASNNHATLSLPVFSRGKLKTSTFEFDNELIDIGTPDGTVKARRVIRKHGSGKRETHVWYAKTLGYAPIQIEQYKRGKLVIRLTLKSINR